MATRYLIQGVLHLVIESALSMRVLAESKDYKITLHENGSDILIVSFGGMPTGISDQGFGTSFCRRYGYDNIYVSQRIGTQYQGLSINQFVEAVSLVLGGYSKVYTYGASLGGYCALYFGGAINANIIAAAPKNSADPFFKKEKFNGFFCHEYLSCVPKSNNPPLLIYDPYRPEESSYIENIVKNVYFHPNFNEVKIDFGGHKILNTMRDLGILVPFINRYISTGEFFLPDFDMSSMAIFHEQKGLMFYRSRNFELAESSFKRAISISPSAEAFAFLLRIYIWQCRYEEGFKLLAKSCEKDNKVSIPKSLYEKFSSEFVRSKYS